MTFPLSPRLIDPPSSHTLQCPIDLITKAKQQSLYKSRKDRSKGAADGDLADDDAFEYLDPVALEALYQKQCEASELSVVRFELDRCRLICDQVGAVWRNVAPFWRLTRRARGQCFYHNNRMLMIGDRLDTSNQDLMSFGHFKSNLFVPSWWSSSYQIRKREKIKRQIVRTYEEEILGSRPAALNFSSSVAAAAATEGFEDGIGSGLHSSPSVVLMGADGGSVAMEVDAAALEAAVAAAGLTMPILDEAGFDAAAVFGGAGAKGGAAGARGHSRARGAPMSSLSPAVALAEGGTSGKRSSRAAAVAANAVRAAALGMENELNEADGGRVGATVRGSPPAHHGSPRMRAAAAQKADALTSQDEEAKLQPSSGSRKIMLRMPQKNAEPSAVPSDLEAAAGGSVAENYTPGGPPVAGRKKSAATPLARVAAGGSRTPAMTPPLLAGEDSARAPSSRIRKQRVIPDAAETVMDDDDDEEAGPSGAGGDLDNDGGSTGGLRKRKGRDTPAVLPSSNKRQRQTPGGAGGGGGGSTGRQINLRPPSSRLGGRTSGGPGIRYDSLGQETFQGGGSSSALMSPLNMMMMTPVEGGCVDFGADAVFPLDYDDTLMMPSMMPGAALQAGLDRHSLGLGSLMHHPIGEGETAFMMNDGES